MARSKIGIGNSGGAGGGGGGGSNVPNYPGSDGNWLLNTAGGVATWVAATANRIAPAFAVALTGGGGGVFEVGATWTPSGLTANPAPNAGGISSPLVSDNQGHTNVPIVGGNPIAPPVASYSLTVPGTVNINVTETSGGVTATSNNVSGVFEQTYAAGLDTASGATGATVVASTKNANLTGGGASGLLTGALAANMIGTTFSYTPTGSEWVYALYPHTSTPGTFADNATGFGFSMSVVATFSFTNEFGVAASYDLYRSDFIQTQPRTVKRTA